jgi:hypothetical protein
VHGITAHPVKGRTPVALAADTVVRQPSSTDARSPRDSRGMSVKCSRRACSCASGSPGKYDSCLIRAAGLRRTGMNALRRYLESQGPVVAGAGFVTFAEAVSVPHSARVK